MWVSSALLDGHSLPSDVKYQMLIAIAGSTAVDDFSKIALIEKVMSGELSDLARETRLACDTKMSKDLKKIWHYIWDPESPENVNNRKIRIRAWPKMNEAESAFWFEELLKSSALLYGKVHNMYYEYLFTQTLSKFVISDAMIVRLMVLKLSIPDLDTFRANLLQQAIEDLIHVN